MSDRYFVSLLYMLRLQDTAGWLPMIAKIMSQRRGNHLLLTNKIEKARFVICCESDDYSRLILGNIIQ